MGGNDKNARDYGSLGKGRKKVGNKTENAIKTK